MAGAPLRKHLSKHAKGNQCRLCKRVEPDIMLTYVNGIRRNTCYACHANEARESLQRKKSHSNNYGSIESLALHTAKLLSDLKCGSFPLLYRPSNTVKGFLTITPDYYYVDIRGRVNLFEPNIYPMGMFIAGLNMILQHDKPFVLEDSEGFPVDLNTVGRGMKAEVIWDHILILDSKLKEYAVKKATEDMIRIMGLAAGVAKEQHGAQEIANVKRAVTKRKNKEEIKGKK